MCNREKAGLGRGIRKLAMVDIEKHNDSDGLQKFPNFVIFQTADGKVNIDVFFKDETLWLSQKLIAELFEKGRSTITEHLKRIFADGELDENVVCRNFRLTTQHGAMEGKTQEKEVKYYNLKAIVAVGYRVNSHRAIEFRKWATGILHEYIIKGFAMDDERLKQIKHFGQDYFDEMLERIREIRMSERRLVPENIQIFMRFRPTTTAKPILPNSFLPPFKTICIGQLQVKQQPK
jgi:hypothetical protein